MTDRPIIYHKLTEKPGHFPNFGFRLILILAFSMVLMGVSVDVKAQPQEGENDQWTTEKLSDRDNVGQPVIVADTSGTIHYFWSQSGLGQEPDWINYATKNGEEWFKNDIVVGGDIGGPVVAIDSDGKLHLVWIDDQDLYYSSAFKHAARSSRGWSDPIRLNSGAVYHPTILVDENDNLHLAWTNLDDPPVVYYSHSEDSGQTWSTDKYFEIERSGAVPSIPQIAIDGKNTLHLVWSLVPTPEYYGGLGVYYVRSEDSGKTWTGPNRLDTSSIYYEGVQAWLASIIAVDDRTLHVVWDSHAESGRRYHQISYDGGLTWSEPNPIWGSFISQTGVNPMVLDNAGNLYLFSAGAYDWLTSQHVYYSLWSGDSWTEPQVVDDSSKGPHYIKVALRLGNELHITWQSRGSPLGQEIWYGFASTDAPSIEPQKYAEEVISTDEPIMSPSLQNAGGEPEETPTRPNNINNQLQVIPQRPGNPQAPIVIPIISVLLFICLAVIVQRNFIRGR